MAVYRRGKSWVADFYFGEVRIRKTFATKKMGETFERDQKLAEFTGKEMPQQQKKICLSDFIQLYQSLHDVQNKPSTQILNKFVFEHLTSFLGNPMLSLIGKAHVEEYKVYRLKAVKPITVNVELRVIRSLLNRGVDWGYLSESPMKGVKLMRVDETAPKFLSIWEGAHLIATAQGQMKTFIMVGLYTGLRRGEMFRLEWSDIDFERREIKVRISKSRRFRIVPMSEKLATQLAKHPRHITSTLVFHNANGSAWKDVRGGFKSVFIRADISPIRIHDMRHSFISNLVASGIDLRTVKELAGHANIQTTMKYAHLAEGQTHRAIASLSWG